MKITYSGKSTYTRSLAKNILLAFLTIVIALTIVALFVRSAISNKLENITRMAQGVDMDQFKPEHVLLLIHQAENTFQESLLSTDSAKSAAYRNKLSQAFNEIDTLLKSQSDTTNLNTAQRARLRAWYYQKLQLSSRLLYLEHDFDSLLNVYSKFNEAQAQNQGLANINIHTRGKNVKSNTDTIRKNIPGNKKGLFGRLKDAIANKNSANANVIEINQNDTKDVIDSVAHKIASRDKNAYAKKIQLLQQHNITLLTTQKDLISLNINISNELERIINDLKEINYNMADELKGMAFKNYQETTNMLNRLYLVAIILILIFAVLLIAVIVKLDQSERLLRKENERAVVIAQQKMDLLLHMSHEIRNPLTAIKGFLYIFGQTNLSPKQAEMLSSVSLSSDMLLRTLNDTLDAAKMESSEFKINSDPFNPDFALQEVVESMAFSAAKKNLSITYNFEGDKEAAVSGDSFRLKQIMINLLSNAIKYTKIGGVAINANMAAVNGENRLQVAIIDTGVGISLEQQAGLFSKYYQTSSARGQTGTGLGLYICKQLIEFQKGQIRVESNAGAGCVFHFYIPYPLIAAKNSQDTIKHTTNSSLTLLNGISILAVDDNELSLMFLKMMTGKWNVKFYEAANGADALDIIAKKPVTIVLTDMQMPGMSGLELMLAIRQLKDPLNKLPVVLISGAPASGEPGKYPASGFSGFLTKPFIEDELISQVVYALKL